jgi:hypothetical protein
MDDEDGAGDDALVSADPDFDAQEMSEAGRVRKPPLSDSRHAPY